MYTSGWGGGAEKTRVVMSGGVASSVTSIGNLVYGSPDKTLLERTQEAPFRMKEGCVS